MPVDDSGSLTKEPPLATLDDTIRLIKPGMSYAELRALAARHTHRDAPGLVRRRFLLVDSNNTIIYDRFLSLVAAEGLQAPRVRKVMYFLWAFRDERIRGFVCERVANQYGVWSFERLTDKDNRDFFERWLNARSATKARSNVERFLIEAGIYRPSGRSIHLELEDGWLQEAAQAAAQHERVAHERRLMLSDPLLYLISRGWHGLANVDNRKVNAGRTKSDGLADEAETSTDPLEDELIDTSPSRVGSEQKWSPSQVKERRSGGYALLNSVAQERASQSHRLLEQVAAKAITAAGYTAFCNKHIDMYYGNEATTVLIEIKSCHQKNFHSQVRRGISQLFEYRYVYRKTLADIVLPLLIVEIEPPPPRNWLIDYLRTLGIALCWKQYGSSRLILAKDEVDSLLEVVCGTP